MESAGACLFSRARAREPPPFAVRCVLFSVDRGVGRFSSRNWNCRSFCGASPATPASDARQRRRHPPDAEGDARVRSFRSRKHPRHISVVFTAKHFRAAFWSASCLICCASPLSVLSAAPPRVWPRPFFKGRVSYLEMREDGARGLLSLDAFIWPGSFDRSVAAFSSARARDMPPDARGSK